MGKDISSPLTMALKRFCRDRLALLGVLGIILILFPAVFAPFIANGKPLAVISGTRVELPFLHSFFAPESSEVLVEKLFNFFALYLPAVIFFFLVCRGRKLLRMVLCAITAVLLLCAFIFPEPVMDKQDYRNRHCLFPRCLLPLRQQKSAPQPCFLLPFF